MHHTAQATAVAAISLLSCVSATPLTRRAVDCNKPSTGLSASCWTTLKMPNYINQFSNTAQGCSDTATFSDCLLRVAEIYDYDACTLVGSGLGSPNNCSAPATTLTNPAVYYSAYNIYAIQQYISDWADAVSSADSETFSLNAIAKTTKDTSIDVPLKALINKASQPQLATTAKAQNAALLAYLAAYPTKLVYAPGTDDSTNVDNMLQQRFVEILSGVEEEKAKYLTMAKDGAFSVKTWSSSEGIKDLLDPQGAATVQADPSTVEDSIAHIER